MYYLIDRIIVKAAQHQRVITPDPKFTINHRTMYKVSGMQGLYSVRELAKIFQVT